MNAKGLYPCRNCSGSLEVIEIVGSTNDGETRIRVRCDGCLDKTIASVRTSTLSSGYLEVYGHKMRFDDGLVVCAYCDIDDALDDDAPLPLRNLYRFGLMKNYRCGKIPEKSTDSVSILKRITEKITVGPVSKK